MLLYHFGYGPYGPARRGKRLRPQMVMQIALTEGGQIDDALDAAAAIEIMHNYSLVHDDIEDRDELRHGRETLWTKYGIAQAINAGDAMCALSSVTLLRAAASHPGDRVVHMVQVLHDAHRVMCDGQSLDLQYESEPYVDLEAYDRMISYKTAALFQAACFLGALSAGCDDATIEEYGKLGAAYGMVFQIRDDVLGAWASADATGKIMGNDIARRKWTFPVVWAISQEPSPARDAIAEAYARGRTLDEREVERVIAALDDLKARDAALAAIARYQATIERYHGAALRDLLLSTITG